MNNIIKKIKDHQVEIMVKGPFINLFITNLYRMPLKVSNVTYIDKKTLTLIVDMEDVKTLQKKFKDYKITIKKEKGIYNLKNLIKKNKIFLICLLAGFIIFLGCQNIIVKVDVIHSDKMIRQLVTDELEDYGIKRLSWKKSYKQIQTIKAKILDKYPDKLEWIEIENIGMTYKVRIEERIITKIKKEQGYCNIVASKGGIITKIINKKGLSLLSSGDYVNTGDIIIAGDITANEEIKESVCANGEVYAEVWYTVNSSVPLNYKEKKKTGKKRINFMYDNNKEKKVILKSRFKDKIVKNKKLFSLWGITFYLQKEYEVKVTNKTYSKNEALKQALKLSKEKINLKLNDKERLITQKVLKSSIKDSKMVVEIFASVEEKIGKVEHYEKSDNNEALE